MTKITKSILGLSMTFLVGLSFCHGAPFWVGLQEDKSYDFPFDKVEKVQCDENTDLGSCVSIKEDETRGGDETIIRRLIKVFNLDILENVENQDHKFLNYVKAILNVALGLLSMVALVMTIYTFYIMFFTENEAGAKKAKQNLVGIFIALAIIGLSWLIVSFIFRRYKNSWLDRQKVIEESNITMVDKEPRNQIYFSV